jgi:hypothetical protein
VTGWAGIPFTELDGQSWPLGFAATLLGIPERDLRELVRITGLQPSGVIRTAPYSRQGRQPRAYPASQLIMICDALTALRESFTHSDNSLTVCSFFPERVVPFDSWCHHE